MLVNESDLNCRQTDQCDSVYLGHLAYYDYISAVRLVDTCSFIKSVREL